MQVTKTIINSYLPTPKAVHDEKRKIAHDLFHGRCGGCHRPYGSGFAYHHLDYNPDRKSSKDFKNTISYNRYILGEVLAFPARFYLLCRGCHHRIDNFMVGMSLVPKDTLARLYLIAFLSQPKPRKPRRGNATNSPVAVITANALENER